MAQSVLKLSQCKSIPSRTKKFSGKKKKKNSFAYSSTRSSPFQLIVIRWYDLFHAGCNGWWTKFSFISGWGDQSFVEAGLDDEKMPKLTMEMRSRNLSPIIVFASSKKKIWEIFFKNLDKKWWRGWKKMAMVNTEQWWQWSTMVNNDGDGEQWWR